MRHHRWLPALAPTLLIGLLATPAPGDDGASAQWSLRGGFQLGFRTVDVGGRVEKYREDVDLEDGPRLFHLSLDLVPPEEMREYFDHLEVDLDRIGGDPFENLRLVVEKYGRFSLKWEQRKSDFFYEDIILPPELASPELAEAGDLHTFDFERVRDSASLTLWLGGSARFDLGFDRFTKKGRSTTTYDIQRDEFEVDRPIDESLNEYRAAFCYDWERVTLILRERVREYENSVEAFLPGASDGSASDDLTALDFFFLDEPYDLSSYGHSVALIARPKDGLLIQVDAVREDLDLDVRSSERAQGIDFLGVPFTTDRDGIAALERQLELLDLGLSYRLTERLALIVDARSSSLDQSGTLDLDDQLSVTSYKLDTTGGEAGLQLELSPRLTLSGGVRSETREVEADGGDPTAVAETYHSGYFALLGWRPDRRLSVSARIDESSFDAPFAGTSPSDRTSLRLRARYARPLGLSLSGVYHLDSLDNTETGWRAEIERLALRVGYRFALLSLSAGYTLFNTDRDIDQTVLTLPGFMGGLELLFPIAYRADTKIIDARFSWAVNPRLKLGGDLRLHENEGSFPLEREQSRLYSEIGFGKGYVAHLGVRRIEYDEGLDDFDDYEADIAELSVGYRWR